MKCSPFFFAVTGHNFIINEWFDIKTQHTLGEDLYVYLIQVDLGTLINLLNFH
jgi:hypothetical protein